MSKTITEKDILDLAAKIAVQAKKERVEKSQIENLLSVIEVASDPANSPWVVALYAYRQAERGRMGHATASLIHEAMIKLSEAGCGKEDLRKLLGFVKWIFESFERKERNIPPRVDAKNLTLQSVLEMLKGD